MLELGLAAKDKTISSLTLKAQQHLTEKQTVLEQNRLQRKEIDSLKGEQEASRAELER